MRWGYPSKILGPAFLSLLAAMCCASLGRAQTTMPAYPDSSEGLQHYFKDILAATNADDRAKVLAMTQSLVLPDPDKWFKEVFGEKMGPKLATEYKTNNKNLGPQLAALLMRTRALGDLEVKVTCVDSVDDVKAKSYQRIAMAAMESPVPLYSVALISKKNPQPAMEVWSIIYSSGRFRLAGKMKTVKDIDDKSDADNP